MSNGPILVCAALLSASWAQAATPPKAPKAPKSDPMIAKMNPFLEFVNAQRQGLADARQASLGDIDLEKGPSCDKDAYARGNLPIPGKDFGAGATTALRAAIEAKPAQKELDDAGTVVADAFDEIGKLIAEVNRYAQSQEFKKDGCKKAQALHRQLIMAWNKYLTADDAIRHDIDGYYDKVERDKLFQTEKQYGKRIRYYHAKTILDAKTLLNAADRPPNTLDLDALKAALAAYEETYARLANITKARQTTKVTKGYKAFADAAEGYAREAKKIVERIEQKLSDSKPRVQPGEARLVQGSLPATLEAYNELVRAHNEVMFAKKAK